MDHISTTHVKLLASDFLSLTQNNHRHHHHPPSFTMKNGRPITRSETVGVVVYHERRDKFLKFQVDDGSGCIPCILWLNQSPDSPYFARRDPYDAILIDGPGFIRITVTDVVTERDPNAEILHWLDCLKLFRDYYKSTRIGR
ncbi:CST complex subunit STN1 [Acorus calamus]|uniref:CST complex subunit STN1 n=1 Tax=Acorus calamus TaxID=4465 RepID=A0AAV9DKG0_ACOCL|nr:CST complex subunit STN1 [Acorus calamus]